MTNNKQLNNNTHVMQVVTPEQLELIKNSDNNDDSNRDIKPSISMFSSNKENEFTNEEIYKIFCSSDLDELSLSIIEQMKDHLQSIINRKKGYIEECTVNIGTLNINKDLDNKYCTHYSNNENYLKVDKNTHIAICSKCGKTFKLMMEIPYKNIRDLQHITDEDIYNIKETIKTLYLKPNIKDIISNMDDMDILDLVKLYHSIVDNMNVNKSSKVKEEFKDNIKLDESLKENTLENMPFIQGMVNNKGDMVVNEKYCTHRKNKIRGMLSKNEDNTHTCFLCNKTFRILLDNVKEQKLSDNDRYNLKQSIKFLYLDIKNKDIDYMDTMDDNQLLVLHDKLLNKIKVKDINFLLMRK